MLLFGFFHLFHLSADLSYWYLAANTTDAGLWIKTDYVQRKEGSLKLPAAGKQGTRDLNNSLGAFCPLSFCKQLEKFPPR